MSKRPTDYYRPAEKPKGKCKSVNVIPSKIEINGVLHHGLITHKCSLDNDHQPPEGFNNPICICECGGTWVKNIK